MKRCRKMPSKPAENSSNHSRQRRLVGRRHLPHQRRQQTLCRNPHVHTFHQPITVAETRLSKHCTRKIGLHACFKVTIVVMPQRIALYKYGGATNYCTSLNYGSVTMIAHNIYLLRWCQNYKITVKCVDTTYISPTFSVVLAKNK